MDGIFRMSGTESSPLLTSSATANTEVINFINIDSRNSTIFPRLAQIGAAWSKFRVKKMHAHYKGEVGANTNGSFVMALIYDAADQVVANWTMQRILATNQNQMTSIWGKSETVKYDPQHASLRWYISGVTTGVAAQNEQTPVSIVYGFYSNLTSTPVGRVHVTYDVEFVEEISPSSNV